PKRRSDRGHSRRLSPDDEDHILALRKEYPTMPVTVFYEHLIEQGEIPENHTSYFTIYRLLKKHNLVGKEESVKTLWRTFFLFTTGVVNH
ncbi:integrase, partial [Geobacillus stearothermophilus]